MKNNQPKSTRRGLLGVAAGGVAAAGLVGAGRPVHAQSIAWTQPSNNNHVLELQSASEFPQGAVKIEYFGHCALRMTSPSGATIMFDPWRNDPSGAWGLWYPNEFPKLISDIGMSTHAHFDHDAIDRVESTMTLDRLVGNYEFADVKITGIADKHACEAPGWYNWTRAIAEFGQDACPPNNPGHMDMVTYIVDMGGIRTLIWGDNRHNPPEEVWNAWGQVDILTLPVDGSEHILSYDQANEIVARLNPKVVIPTHYLNESTTITLSTLDPADEWVEMQSSFQKLDKPTLELGAEDVAAMDKEFLYFGHNAITG